MVPMSAQGRSMRDITSPLRIGEDYVRDVIHALNERGFDAPTPEWSGDDRRRSVNRYASASA
ncbi:hypothetical protein GCM10010405_23290 [Streptomyces macrosporus]|uniref:Uncharacterized protein n=1 Tax=Streptomyces macrosporus TaxID=44032 RepID=A0ABN3JVK5_9ACTN